MVACLFEMNFVVSVDHAGVKHVLDICPSPVARKLMFTRWSPPPSCLIGDSTMDGLKNAAALIEYSFGKHPSNYLLIIPEHMHPRI